MTNYSDREIAQLATRIKRQIELDERYAREAQEAFEAKTDLSISQKIAELIEQFWGFVSQEIFERVRSLLPW
jgi:hypothetical protein